MSGIVTQVDEARQRHAEAVEKMEDWDARCQDLPEEATEEETEFIRGAFLSAKAEAARWAEQVERLTAIADARRQMQNDEPDEKDNGDKPRPAGDLRVNEPLVYARRNGNSFFRDLAYQKSDPEAAARLSRHNEQMKVELRDLTTGAAGAGVIPPLYMPELLADLPRAARPLGDAAPKMPLSDTGMSITLPKIATGTATAIQATENSAVQETDADIDTVTVPINTIAGQQDISRQLFERAQPGIDEILFRDLALDYDQKVDVQLISGLGSSGQHQGLRTVSGKIAVSYTDATPTAAELVPKIYDAIQQLSTARYLGADTIVMHPRRAAWLASNLSSTFPLFQLGSLNQAAGTQDQGFVNGFAGLRVVLDPNIGTTYGAGTNEDEIYVLRLADMVLMEGPMRSRVYEDVGSGTLTVRLQVFGYSAWVSTRQPKSIVVISGTGLVAPTF